MSPTELESFERTPSADAAIVVRRIDDRAKVRDQVTPDLSQFHAAMARLLDQSSG